MGNKWTEIQLLDILLNHLQNDPDQDEWAYGRLDFHTNEHEFTPHEYYRALLQFEDDNLIDIIRLHGNQTKYILTHHGKIFKGYAYQERKEREIEEDRKNIKKTTETTQIVAWSTLAVLLVQVAIQWASYMWPSTSDKEQSKQIIILHKEELQSVDSVKKTEKILNSSTDTPSSKTP